MNYISECEALLMECCKDENTVEGIERVVANGARKMVDECTKIILCGTMPFSQCMAIELSKTKEVYYFDTSSSAGLYAQCPILSVTKLKQIYDENTLFIILSRSEIEFYNYIITSIDDNAKILFYTAVELAYPELFSKKFRYDYTVDGIRSAMQYISENAKGILAILENLADEKSKDTFARIILFRVYMKMEYNKGIRSVNPDYLEDFFTWEEKECIIDLGGNVGDTLYDVKKLLDKKKLEFEYHLFEPMASNLEEAKKIKVDEDKVFFYDVCVGDEDKYIDMVGEGLFAKISSQESEKEGSTHMVRLDDIMEDKRVTFLKMDIEGSEELALLGGVNTVKSNYPKLAICIYHKYDDIYKLITLIMDMVKEHEYKFYIRAQRESVVTETVLFAVPM